MKRRLNFVSRPARRSELRSLTRTVHIPEMYASLEVTIADVEFAVIDEQLRSEGLF